MEGQSLNGKSKAHQVSQKMTTSHLKAAMRPEIQRKRKQRTTTSVGNDNRRPHAMSTTHMSHTNAKVRESEESQELENGIKGSHASPGFTMTDSQIEVYICSSIADMCDAT